MTAFCLAAVLLFPVPTFGISAQKAILMDGTTGRILYEKDAHSRSLIASTTKIMTALVVCEQCNVLDRMRIPKEAVGIEGSSLYLREGEVLTVQELLYGLMLQSGNDAAVALAIYCGGTMEGFVQLMNDKAASLGLTNTHFENPHGLDSPGHFSSARDLAVLASYAMENPIFAKTVSTKTVRIGERSLRNHNKLLWRVDGAEGVKTGYTIAAGRILVSSAQRQGRRLIAVTINDGNDWKDHEQLLAEGFTNYSVRQLVESGEVLGTVSVLGGVQSQVEVKACQDFLYSVSDTEQPYTLLAPSEFVYAPVAEGQDGGYAYVCIGDTVVGKIPVEYADTVEQLPPVKKSLWERLFGGNGS
jgi:D-alanyl-D-alanine carboxypeptidase